MILVADSATIPLERLRERNHRQSKIAATFPGKRHDERGITLLQDADSTSPRDARFHHHRGAEMW